MSEQKMREALQGFLNIVSESRGVYGYHLNGDIAEWDEFPEVDLACEALAQPADVRLTPNMLKRGRLYNFKGQSERLVYLRPNGSWHQFALCSDPTHVWSEVLQSDLHMIEETNEPVDLTDDEILEAANEAYRALPEDADEQDEIIAVSRAVIQAHEAKKEGGV